jgi:hypothetical protein
VLDALIMVDPRSAPAAILERYFGKPQAASRRFCALAQKSEDGTTELARELAPNVAKSAGVEPTSACR